MMTDLTSQVSEIWLECSKMISKRFRLEAPPIPNSIEIIKVPDILQLGGLYIIEDRELQVTHEVLEGKIPLKGFVFGVCLFNSLPQNLCPEAKRDLASEFTRQSLKKTDKDRWMSAWRSVPTRRISANLIYNSFEIMTWIDALGGNIELDKLIHEFVCMFRYGKSLNFEEYVEYMFHRVQNIVVALNYTDVKIVDALMKNRDASYRQIAESTGLSESWVCTRVNHLKRKYVLIEHTAVPFSAIGIRTFHVLLTGPSWSDPNKLLAKCPFLYDVRVILNGPWQTMARLAVPDSPANIHSLEKMISILQEFGIGYDVAETFSVGFSNSFYHYNAKTHGWEIPWVAMEGWGHRIKEESIDQIMTRIDYPARTTDHYLDSLDMRILKSVTQGITSTRALRSDLSVGQTKLVKRLKKLKAEVLIRRDWAVYNIGLVERTALRATDRRTASLLDAWSRELPRVFLRYEKNRHLLMIVELPKGDSTKMMSTLRLLKWPVTISPLSSSITGHWQFPSQFWDVENQRWQAQKNDVDSWLNTLREGCRNLVDKTMDAQHESLASVRPRY
jgi:DNA-binding Lrp family transcriptional regulator